MSRENTEWHFFWQQMWDAGMHDRGPFVTMIRDDPLRHEKDQRDAELYRRYRYEVTGKESAKRVYEKIKNEERRDQRESWWIF